MNGKGELSDERINERITKHRTAEVRLTIVGPGGKPLANAPVVIRQVRHKFLFGCNAYMLTRCGKAELERGYRRRFKALLNYATLPFYWGGDEREQGKPDAKRLREMSPFAND